MFFHEFKKTLKVFLRQKAMIFWALIFPLVLGVFFKLALGNVKDSNNFEAIKVGINESLFDDEYFKNFTDQMKDEDLLDPISAKDEKILDQDDISAYIDKKDKVILKKNGVRESILVNILKYYNMNENMVRTIMEKKPNTDLSNIFVDNTHIESGNPNKDMDPTMTFFFALIGFQIIYGYAWGLSIIFQYEANLTTIAKRNAISPLNKKISLLSSMCVGFLLNFFIALFTMVIFNKILGVDFSNKLAQLLLIVAIGSLTGVSLGMVIGSCNKANIETKIGIGLAISLLLSFLAGMMVAEIKIIISEKAPLINKLNPVALISDGIYSLYYYDNLDRYYNNLIWLIGVTIVLVLLTYIFTRGKQYDSL